MTQATLTLDGMDPLTGTAETGGDYIRFATRQPMDRTPDNLCKGQIDIDGKTEKVMVKTVQDADNGVEMTLQRFEPSAS